MFLRFVVKPNSFKNELYAGEKGTWLLKITAPAQEGKANKKIIEFLAEMLDIPKSHISICGDGKSRYKKIEIDRDEKEILPLLEKYSAENS